MTRAWLVALVLPVAASAQDYRSPEGWDAAPTRGQLGNPVIGAPLGANDPPRQAEPPPPPQPAGAIPLADLRRKLIGKPVHGAGTARIGIVNDVVVGADNRISTITIQVDRALDPDRASLPVPWAWVHAQLDQPILVVPWDPGLVAWLTEPGRSRRPAAVPPPEERAAWESAAAAQLEEWRARVDARAASATGKPDSDLRQLQLSYGSARDRLDRLREAEPEAWPTEQVKLQAELDDLSQTWSELAEAR